MYPIRNIYDIFINVSHSVVLGDSLAEIETVTVSSKGQVTIPSKIRRELGIVKGERLLVAREENAIKLVPVPKLSELAGVDEGVFRGRKPSDEIETMRKEWTDGFDERVRKA